MQRGEPVIGTQVIFTLDSCKDIQVLGENVICKLQFASGASVALSVMRWAVAFSKVRTVCFAKLLSCYNESLFCLYTLALSISIRQVSSILQNKMLFKHCLLLGCCCYACAVNSRLDQHKCYLQKAVHTFARSTKSKRNC